MAFVKLKEITNSEYLKRFGNEVLEDFEGDWLHFSTADELKSLESHYATLSCPGVIGCLDCARWE